MADGTRSKTRDAEAELRTLSEKIDNAQRELEARGRNEPSDPVQQTLDVLSPGVDQLQALIQRINRLEQEVKASPRTYSTFDERLGSYPSQSPGTPRRSIPVPSGPIHIRVKDAIESVPTFDGYKPSVFQFLRACERAKNMVSDEQEPHLARLLTNKLIGHALLAVEDSHGFDSVEELGDRLRTIFAPQKSVNQYRGDLGNIYQKPNEHILDYISRIRDIRLAILDGIKRSAGHISRDKQREIDQETLEAFCNGLPPDVLVRLKIEKYSSLDDAYTKSVKLSEQIKKETERYKDTNNLARSTIGPRNQNFRQNPIQRPNYPPREQEYELPRRNSPPQQQQQPQQQQSPPRQNYEEDPPTCRYCKRQGHTMNECRRYQYKVETGQLIPYGRQGNEQRNPAPPSANRDAGNERRRMMTATIDQKPQECN